MTFPPVIETSTAAVEVVVTSSARDFLCSLSLVSVAALPARSFPTHAVRFASKKTGGSSKNLGGKSPGRRYGFKKQDGSERPVSQTF